MASSTAPLGGLYSSDTLSLTCTLLANSGLEGTCFATSSQHHLYCYWPVTVTPVTVQLVLRELVATHVLGVRLQRGMLVVRVNVHFHRAKEEAMPWSRCAGQVAQVKKGRGFYAGGRGFYCVQRQDLRHRHAVKE